MLNQTRGCLKVIIKCPDLGQFYKHGSSAPTLTHSLSEVRFSIILINVSSGCGHGNKRKL